MKYSLCEGKDAFYDKCPDKLDVMPDNARRIVCAAMVRSERGMRAGG